jgi:hypothetical protein
MEMLPWDSWGAMIEPEALPMSEETIALMDRVAALAMAPDAHFAKLRALYEDVRLAVPDIVYNAVLKKRDAVVV